jgi:hypothetical protein
MLAYLFVVLAVLLRVGAGTGAFATLGFSLVGASLLFFGSRMPRKHFWVPVALIIGSDIYLNLRIYQLSLARGWARASASSWRVTLPCGPLATLPMPKTCLA